MWVCGGGLVGGWYNPKIVFCLSQNQAFGLVLEQSRTILFIYYMEEVLMKYLKGFVMIADYIFETTF